MSNTELVNDLITAIHFDRFAEIEARHHPLCRFYPFLGPDLSDAVGIGDWHREWLKDYADCSYTDIEYLDDKDMVAIRATIEAKGYNWNRFHQNVVEVFRFEEDLIIERRQYAMLPDLELDKKMNRAYEKVREDRDAKSRKTKKAVPEFYEAVLAGDAETARSKLKDDAMLLDTVYGVVSGPDELLDVLFSTPKPAFGAWHVKNTITADQNSLVELAIDPIRPRSADWVRMMGEEIAVIERHWMLREIGMLHALDTGRHRRRVIMPI